MLHVPTEMDIIRAFVDTGTSQNLTRRELAKRTGINQADISKLKEGQEIHPSII